ncbi:MAG TPA: hypothetical protein VMI13_01320 [Solirubrobacteraceae bacterium]|nr:hypothetical protein [Solirubrobacteraceae bacterium]
MLFDLRGRGRRTTVRIIYIGLALLIGIGLVGFGVGGGFGGGGIVSNLNNREGSGGPNYSKQIANYRKQLSRNPNDVKTWEQLTKTLSLQAGGEAYKTPSGALTPAGKKVYAEVAYAWNHYSALTKNPNLGLAKIMVRIFDEEGLNEPASTVDVLQTIVAAEPNNASYYGFLAAYAYLAHKNALGDLAAHKAVALAPVGQRTHLKVQLAEVKKQANAKKGATGATGTTAGAGGTTSLVAP